MELGYALSAEEHPPLALVEHARHAEHAGFTFALVSDHFHPWIDRQGHSAFVWNVVGGIAASTHELELGTGVTCPLIRMHPALVAQAARVELVQRVADRGEEQERDRRMQHRRSGTRDGAPDPPAEWTCRGGPSSCRCT